MPLQEILHNINKLQKEADALRPIPKERLNVLNQKLRLDWNYHSNAIEGNTLTMSETRMLILHGFHTGNKLGRHYEEMKLHNDVLTTLEGIVRKNEPMSEVLIRGLHHQLMGDEYFVKAYDDLGIVVNVKGRPGEYKVKSNGVNRIINGKEVFVPFKTPDEVRIEMPELIQWYRQEEEKKELHPVELAAIFHFRFVTLHPFDDGNGRISRLLMNMILMRAGYVPAIIRLEEREQYIYALAQAQDGESLEPFVEIVAMETERSLNLLIKAAKGETIDEPGDLDKKISILNKKVDELDKILGSDEIKISSSVEVLDKIYAESIVPLMYKLDESLKKIDGLFYETQRNVYVNGAFGASNTKLSEILPQIEGYWKNTNKGPRAIYEFSFQGYLKGLKKAGTRDLNIYNLIKIKFNELKYSIYLGSNETLIMEKLYHQILFDEELDILAEKFLDQLVKEVEQVVDNLRNNGR